MIKAIYFSPTKTTKKIINQIAQELQNILNCQMQVIDITLPSKREEQMVFSKEDILLFGLPVYAGRIPAFLEAFVRNIKGNNNLAVAVTVYGNRDYDDALLELTDILTDNKFNVIAAAAFIGEHSYSYKVAAGRPDAKDLQMATEFASKLAPKLQNINASITTNKITIRGNFPYKERIPSAKVAPKTKNSCVRCMLCSKLCPVLAIAKDNPLVTDKQKCIRCFACVKACPNKSKYFDDESVLAVVNKLETNFIVRKEPEVFI